MSMGSGQIKPVNLQSKAASAYTSSFGNYLNSILSGFMTSGKNPLQSPVNPMGNAVMQQYQGLLTGQDLGNGPYGAANTYLQDLISGKDQLDSSPYVKQAQSTFKNDIAPGIRESLGAQYGVRFGTPVAESLSRAGERVSTDLNSQLLGLQQQRDQMRLGASQFAAGQQQGLLKDAFGAGAYSQSVGTADLERLLSFLLGGGNLIGAGSGQWMYPQYGQSQNSQLLSALLSTGGAVAGAYFGGPAGAAVGQKAGQTIAGK